MLKFASRKRNPDTNELVELNNGRDIIRDDRGKGTSEEVVKRKDHKFLRRCAELYSQGIIHSRLKTATLYSEIVRRTKA